MKHIVFVGPGSTGKTTMVNRTAHELIRLGFETVPFQSEFEDENTYNLPRLGSGADFFMLFKRDNTIILCYSWSDTPTLINWFRDILIRLSNCDLTPSLVIMCSRDASEWLYGYTRSTLSLTAENAIEIPLGRMVRGPRREAGVRWYLPAVSRLVNEFVLPAVLGGEG